MEIVSFCLQEARVELDGFEKLFSRYLVEGVDQSSIDWQEIQPPPEGTVNIIDFVVKSFV